MSLSTDTPLHPLRALLSHELGSMQGRIGDLTQEYRQLWLETPDDPPEFPVSFSPERKRELEEQVTELLERAEQERMGDGTDPEQLGEAMKGSSLEMESLCRRAGLYFDQSFATGFLHATREFLARVRDFDSTLAPENIYQALRNLWIANSLQVLMGLEMACSAPIFAYSMLYPYSDNLNDDPGLSLAGKWTTNDRFRLWLEGKEAVPVTAAEEKIQALVGMIGNEFFRQDCPGVFQSLLGIFNAQIKSLLQQKQHQTGAPADLLAISVEKGGTSVLADGYLIRGSLEEEWESFCFGYGIFLQFADDIQDVEDDRTSRHQTLYSLGAGRGVLDRQANRLFHFMRRVIDRHLSAPEMQRCRELILRNCIFMVQGAICKHPHLYSPAYLRAIEEHFPLSLPFYRRVKRQLKAKMLAAGSQWARPRRADAPAPRKNHKRHQPAPSPIR